MVALSKGRDLITAPRMLEGLQAFIGSGHHHFWPDQLSLGDPRAFDGDAVIRHQQLTDVYLLGLAVKHEGRDGRPRRDPLPGGLAPGWTSVVPCQQVNAEVPVGLPQVQLGKLREGVQLRGSHVAAIH